ncbi:cysteine hydrolase family protein [Acinetobacter piscicola]|uniref:cysteine hydrolase family protein n=1 Tax=Acinetobacter piscicola TaxID=2006115 RepID=UPI000B7E3149|nr:cysteine hydrolase family protein [Acinetobacter piscicola]
MSKTALLVIDVQNDYFPQGKMELFCAEQALKQVNRLEASFIKNDQPIIYIQHIANQPNASFFEAETEGVALHSGLRVKADSIVIEKHYPNSFFQTTLKAELERLGIEKLVVSGMMTHMCVDATSRAAAELGYQPTIIAEATATRQLSYSDRTVQAEDVQTACLSAFQMFSEVVSIDDYLK